MFTASRINLCKAVSDVGIVSDIKTRAAAHLCVCQTERASLDASINKHKASTMGHQWEH